MVPITEPDESGGTSLPNNPCENVFVCLGYTSCNIFGEKTVKQSNNSFKNGNFKNAF